MEAQLPHEIGAMVLDGAWADRQALADLRIVEALGGKLEYFALARGERVVGVGNRQFGLEL